MARKGPRRRPPTRDVTIKYFEPIPGCIAVILPEERNLFYALGRIQEKWENPYFKDKVGFTYKDVTEYYIQKVGKPAFSIYKSYNLPIEAFTPFLKGEMGKNNDAEERVLKRIREQNPKYVIGFLRKDYEEYRHVLRHAIYHLSSKYRRSMNRILSRWKEKEPKKFEEIETFLRLLKYDDTVIEDEMQVQMQEAPWPRRLKLSNAFLTKFHTAYVRAVKQLQDETVLETTDWSGEVRIRRKVEKFAIEGIKASFNKKGKFAYDRGNS